MSEREESVSVGGTEARDVVLAFSGGLDTSFCVPYLREQGFRVHTVFADTGGVEESERRAIEARAIALGAASHRTVDLRAALWEGFVRPFLWSGAWYQGRYPLLVSDRYAIVDACVARCRELGTRHIAHGCTGMGNDQVRFDLAIRALGDFTIHAPIREIQREHREVRAFEQRFLEERGFSIPAKAKRYTINENILGVTLSGGEIDRFEEPSAEARAWCAPREAWPNEPLRVRLRFERGEPVALDGRSLPGIEILDRLNREFARYGVGRGIYTGDTTIGLKGRIVFEAPGLTALATAHRALEEAILSKHQNRFKPLVASKWTELVYEGFYFDPLKRDLEAFLASSQSEVEGEVLLESHGGVVEAVAVRSSRLLITPRATYAQGADWGVQEAEGFIRLYGMSSTLWAEIRRQESKA
ncbi:MAG: argininosuccinate synthase [Lysobacterales bacterium]|jgi:argininosuccinate synthase|nr:MAG: argininosuccinate synthase [Xanthomonadales bacterium]